MVVAQLVERALPHQRSAVQIQSSANFICRQMYYIDKNKEKETRNGHKNKDVSKQRRVLKNSWGNSFKII